PPACVVPSLPAALPICTQTIRFRRAIIAAGSEAVKLPFLPKDDPRIVTSTGALELRQLPKRMLIIGGGIIGLEMGTVYSTLGARDRKSTRLNSRHVKTS